MGIARGKLHRLPPSETRPPGAWWQKWFFIAVGVAAVAGAVIAIALPDRTPKPQEPEAEIYLQPVDGHGISGSHP
jgi:hypothetical protein